MQSNTQSIGRALIAALALATTGSFGFAANAQYYVNDPLATTVAIADAAGEIAAMEADAFGAPLAIGEAPGRFTGKPYDADLGAFVFPFRNYRPEEGRWMSADPSGFPDGVNGRIYAPCAFSELDTLGLTSVSNLTEALAHWRSNAGGTVDATDDVDAEIKGYFAFGVRVSEIQKVWQSVLKGVDPTQGSGQITRTGTTWGVQDFTGKTVGSVDLTFPEYTISWTSSLAGYGQSRYNISGTSTLNFTYNDLFEFRRDPSRPITILTDSIPGVIAREGTPFLINGSFTHTIVANTTISME
jgi:RHS repeat-associated protein